MRRALLVCAALLAPQAAWAERLIIGLSTEAVPVTSNFSGATVAVFAVIEQDGQAVSRRGYDAVVTVRGPARTQVVRRRERLGPIWINGVSRTYVAAPFYYATLSNRPLPEAALEPVRREGQLGIDMLQLLQLWDWRAPGEDAVFREAFLTSRREEGLYVEESGEEHVRFLAPNVFRARIPLPSNVPVGGYSVEVRVLSDGFTVGRETVTFTVDKMGLEAAVYEASRQQPLVYGALSVVLALSTGWLAGVIFRRN
jgi:uncharacterized protein (TIGR02186 family)